MLYAITDHGLDFSQKMAVASSLKEKMTLVIGPPGTGKTTTITSIIDNMAKQGGSILATAPSNCASDHLVEAIAKTGLNVGCMYC